MIHHNRLLSEMEEPKYEGHSWMAAQALITLYTHRFLPQMITCSWGKTLT